MKLEGCEKVKGGPGDASRIGRALSTSRGKPLILAVLCVGGGGRPTASCTTLSSVVAECESCRLGEVKTKGGRRSAKAS